VQLAGDPDTLGLVIGTQRGVVILQGKNQTTLAHELIHTLTINSDHSPEPQVEGVGSNKSEVWTVGQSLDPFVVLGTLANNIFGEFSPSALPYGISRPEYNLSFKSLRQGNVDPKVVLVTGIIGSNGGNRYFEAQRGEAFLDIAPTAPDLTIQGLNSTGTVVSTVFSQSNNKLELISDTGAHRIVQAQSSFFTATLPDDGTVQSIRVSKGTQVLFTEAVDKLTLQSVIDGLNVNSFKVKQNLAKASLKVIEVQFGNYLKAKQRGQFKAAKLHLLFVREAIILSCKDQIILENGVSVSKKKVVELIDAELRNLR
jgi:hypothetical protein